MMEDKAENTLLFIEKKLVVPSLDNIVETASTYRAFKICCSFPCLSCTNNLHYGQLWKTGKGLLLLKLESKKERITPEYI